MKTPPDYLRELLLDMIEDISDADVARAHHRVYPGSTLDQSTVNRFKYGYVDKAGRKVVPAEGTTPTPLIQEAVAAATGTTPTQNWTEAIRRWQVDSIKSARRRRGRKKSD